MAATTSQDLDLTPAAQDEVRKHLQNIRATVQYLMTAEAPRTREQANLIDNEITAIVAVLDRKGDDPSNPRPDDPSKARTDTNKDTGKTHIHDEPVAAGTAKK
jgi:hypothetical protein